MTILPKMRVTKILVISLTNIGDVVLTFPVLDILKRDFPRAKLSVVIGPKAESLLKNNPVFDKIYIFHKHQSALKTLRWLWRLRQERFDMVIDLRNTAIPFMLGASYKTPVLKKKTENRHMKDKHLQRLKTVYDYSQQQAAPRAVFIDKRDQAYVQTLIRKNIGNQQFMIIAPGAADQAKRWTEEGFAVVADTVTQKGIQVIFVGDHNDRTLAEQMTQKISAEAVNFCGQINLVQLAALMRQAKGVLSNDSAPMHLASYLNRPTLALFGPTSPRHYGPWGKKGQYIQSPTRSMRDITVKQVLERMDAFI